MGAYSAGLAHPRIDVFRRLGCRLKEDDIVSAVAHRAHESLAPLIGGHLAGEGHVVEMIDVVAQLTDGVGERQIHRLGRVATTVIGLADDTKYAHRCSLGLWTRSLTAIRASSTLRALAIYMHR